MNDFYCGRNVFIAGGAGLIGQSLIKQLLNRGSCIVASQYKKRKIDIVNKNLSVINLDLFEHNKVCDIMKNVDIVFIAATTPGGAKSTVSNPLDIVSYNLKLQFGLMECAYRSNVDRVCFVSSSYIYPHTGRPSVESDGFEGDPIKPMIFGLGWVKRYLETVCKFLHMQGKTKFAVIRPTSMYGPHDNFDLESCHAIPALIHKFSIRPDPLEVWGDGSEIRCHTYVDDLVEGLLCVTERYAVAEPINICTSETSTIRDVVGYLSQISDWQPRIIYDTNKPTTVPYKVSSPAKALELLGWKAKTQLKDGLQKTFDWFNQYKESNHGMLSTSISG